MSNIADKGDATDLSMPCPFCGEGELRTDSGVADHSETLLVWRDMRCSKCNRPFTFTAYRAPRDIT